MSKAIKFRNKNNEPIYPCPYYPVGSVYISFNNTDPSTFFGGTWERIKDRFLLSAGDRYAVENKGGSDNHNHGYRVGYFPYYGGLIGDDDRGVMIYDYESSSWKTGASDSGMPGSGVGNSGIQSSSKSTSSAKYSTYGKTTSTSSMPPFIAVYMWRRIK